MNHQATPEPISVDDASARLVDDIKLTAADGNALLQAGIGAGTDKFSAARAAAEAKLCAVGSSLDRTCERIEDRARGAVQASHAYVKQNPWLALGIAAACGVLLGLLSKRR